MSVELDHETRIKTLALKVQAMRDKQREYFNPKRRTANTLRQAKALESRVDQMVAKILDERPRLF